MYRPELEWLARPSHSKDSNSPQHQFVSLATPSPSRRSSSSTSPSKPRRCHSCLSKTQRLWPFFPICVVLGWFVFILYAITSDVLAPPNFLGSIQQPQHVHLSIVGHHTITITWATAAETARSTVQVSKTIDGFTSNPTVIEGESTRFDYPATRRYAFEHPYTCGYGR